MFRRGVFLVVRAKTEGAEEEARMSHSGPHSSTQTDRTSISLALSFYSSTGKCVRVCTCVCVCVLMCGVRVLAVSPGTC